MSKVIVCRSKTAENPFTFLNTKVEIYSYEELCFYIYNNTVLISKSSLSDKLFTWIRDEIDMPLLADRLLSIVNKAYSAEDVLVEILSAGNYYEEDEIRSYTDAWGKYSRLSRHQRLKLKADGYLGYRRYIRAATIYDGIIDEADDISDDIFLGNVYHNRAVAAASNFELTNAKEYFLRAYELNDNPESIKGYFYVVAIMTDTAGLREEIRRMDMGEDYFESIMGEIGESKADVSEMTIYAMLERAVYNKMHRDIGEYDRRMDIILSQLKDEFRDQAI